MLRSLIIGTACALPWSRWGSPIDSTKIYDADLLVVDGVVVSIEGGRVVAGDGILESGAEYLRENPGLAEDLMLSDLSQSLV